MIVNSVGKDGLMNAARRACGLAQQPLQLCSVQAVTTDDAPIQEQHRHIQSMAALQNGVAVDVDDFDRG
jgi:hypothetical protein